MENLFDKKAIKARIEDRINQYNISDEAKSFACGSVDVKIVYKEYSHTEGKYVRVYVGGYGKKKMFSSKAGGEGLDYVAIQEEAKWHGEKFVNERKARIEKDAIREGNKEMANALSKEAPSFSVWASDKPGQFQLYFGNSHTFTEEQVRAVIKALS